MTQTDLMAAAAGRWRAILGGLCAILAVAMLYLLLATPKYAATSSLLFDSIEANPVAETTPVPSTPNVISLGTEADVVHSAAVARQVIERLHLESNPMLRERWERKTHEETPFNPWLVDLLLTWTDVEPTLSRLSNVLVITCTTPDPNLSAAMANAFAMSFLEKQVALRTAPARSYAGWYEGRAAVLRHRLEQAQARMTAYRQSQGLTGADKLDIESNRLQALAAELATAQSQSADAVSRARADASGSPDVIASTVSQSIRSSIAVKTGTLGQLRAVYGPNHPLVQTAEAELAALKARLGAETGTVTQALSEAADSARAREATLRALVAEQRQKVLMASGRQDKLLLLQRDVDLARLAFETAQQRTGSVTLESQLQQTSATLLDKAVPPNLPSSPKVPLVLFLAVILGTIVGVIAALVLEILSPRVRTRSAVLRVTERPVLIELPRLPKVRRLAGA